MTTLNEAKDIINMVYRYNKGRECYYCKQIKRVAMYRLYHLQQDDILFTACFDCLPKVKKSRVANQWKEYK